MDYELDNFELRNIEQFKHAIEVFQKVQNNIAAFREKDEPEKILKVGTSLLVAMVYKIQNGKLPTDFTAEDWEEIADHISEYAVEADETVYSAYVFMFYAWFIEQSVAQISSNLSEKKQAAILSLSDTIKAKTEQLRNEEISEVEYIDDCLWICLEAMIKLVSGTIDAALGFDKNELVGAAMMLGMEYGRFVLYKRENELVTEYLHAQKVLDAELAVEYEKYMEELNEQSAQFQSLIEMAFDPNFGEILINSVKLARAAGVEEDEILKTTQDIDEYFM